MKLRYKVLGIAVLFVGAGMLALGLAVSHNSPCGPAPVPANKTDLMKAVVYRCYGSPDVLKLEERDKPVPAADEILVRVHAASVNPLDWHYMTGTPYVMRLEAGLGSPKDPRMGVDFAGTVEAVGPSVTHFKPGDEVFGGRDGAFAEYVTVREVRAVARKPANMSFEQAAAVPIAGITALQALRDKAQVHAGQKVLINGASGGVGTFAVQIAKSLGAEVTGVCSTRNLDMVRSIGADHVIDYTREDFTRGTQHYDVIVDNVGTHSVAEYERVLNAKGVYVMIGSTTPGNWFGWLELPLVAKLRSPFTSQKLGMMLADLNHKDLDVLGELMQSGKLTPVIDRSYRLSEVPAAIRYLQAGHARGKVVITVD
jgi:NADPH:quinone reductase-like Zn-dependent oxidoreductase